MNHMDAPVVRMILCTREGTVWREFWVDEQDLATPLAWKARCYELQEAVESTLNADKDEQMERQARETGVHHPDCMCNLCTYDGQPFAPGSKASEY